MEFANREACINHYQEQFPRLPRYMIQMALDYDLNHSGSSNEKPLTMMNVYKDGDDCIEVPRATVCAWQQCRHATGRRQLPGQPASQQLASALARRASAQPPADAAPADRRSSSLIPISAASG